jgi:hypothetical protein
MQYGMNWDVDIIFGGYTYSAFVEQFDLAEHRVSKIPKIAHLTAVLGLGKFQVSGMRLDPAI